MDDFGTPVDISVPVFVDNDFGVDDEGRVGVLSFIYVGDSEDAIEVSVPFEHVIENLIEYWKMEPAPEAISVLNSLAYIFDDAAQRMWSAVDDLEGYRAELEAEQFPEM